MKNLVDVFLRRNSPDFGSFFIKQDLAFELGLKECVIGEFYKERWDLFAWPFVDHMGGWITGLFDWTRLR